MKNFEKLYQMMLEEAVKNDLPKAYKNDLLVHDKRLLQEANLNKWTWVLRESGTHLWAEDIKYEFSEPYRVYKALVHDPEPGLPEGRVSLELVRTGGSN